MRKIFIPLIASALTLGVASCNSCSGEKKDNHDGAEAKGGVYMGGVMRLNEVEAFKSLNPISVNEIVSLQAVGKLMRLKQNGHFIFVKA